MKEQEAAEVFSSAAPYPTPVGIEENPEIYPTLPYALPETRCLICSVTVPSLEARYSNVTISLKTYSINYSGITCLNCAQLLADAILPVINPTPKDM